MSQASSSPALTRRSSAARVAQQPGALAVVEDTTPLLTIADLEAPIDNVTGLPLIICTYCRDVRVFAATMTQYQYNNGKRYFKCPRKNFSNVSAVVQMDQSSFIFC